MFSSSHIVDIRKQRGFSQEVLAERSGVSLRTIQRVERGETAPRGHTLQALATALEVALEDFRVAPEQAASPPAPSPAELRSDPQFLQLLNLSTLSFLVVPLLNIVLPLVLWQIRKNVIRDVAEVGRRIIGFQVLWQVCSFFLFLLVLAVHLATAPAHEALLPVSLLAIMLITYAVNVAVIGYNAYRLRQGNLNLYPIRL
jgi:transcriptional regulator with XRE-family HTH domain